MTLFHCFSQANIFLFFGDKKYCSKQCQKADWKDDEDPHKIACQAYCNNTNPNDWKGPEGQQFPVPVGLTAIRLMKIDDLWDYMRTRADLFLSEVKRVTEFGEENCDNGIGLVVNVMYNFDRPILQGSVTFMDPTVPTILPNGISLTGTHECVYYVLFESIGDGGEDVRRRLHPSFGGSGEISDELRGRVVEGLKKFFLNVSGYGLHIKFLTYSRGLMWMSNDDFRDGAAKELEEANGGKRIVWTPNFGYAMEDSFLAATKAAFG